MLEDDCRQKNQAIIRGLLKKWQGNSKDSLALLSIEQPMWGQKIMTFPKESSTAQKIWNLWDLCLKKKKKKKPQISQWKLSRIIIPTIVLRVHLLKNHNQNWTKSKIHVFTKVKVSEAHKMRPRGSIQTAAISQHTLVGRALGWSSGELVLALPLIFYEISFLCPEYSYL